MFSVEQTWFVMYSHCYPVKYLKLPLKLQYGNSRSNQHSAGWKIGAGKQNGRRALEGMIDFFKGILMLPELTPKQSLVAEKFGMWVLFFLASWWRCCLIVIIKLRGFFYYYMVVILGHCCKNNWCLIFVSLSLFSQYPVIMMIIFWVLIEVSSIAKFRGRCYIRECISTYFSEIGVKCFARLKFNITLYSH